MVNITNPIIVNLGESAVIECSAFTPTRFAYPQNIILRYGSSVHVVFAKSRITEILDGHHKIFTFRDTERSDNGLVLRCGYNEFFSPAVMLQVICEYQQK